MASNSRSKLRVEDRISGLPDSLLCHILSFMLTKNSVCTSILSSRWKRVWAAVPILDFRELAFPDPESFVLFVSRVLYFRNSSGIQKFKLECYCIDRFSHIDGWIRAALMQNLTELDISGSEFGTFLEAENLVLRKSVFLCKTLVVLKLRSVVKIDTPTSWCSPRLKVLDIQVYFPVNDLFQKLLSGCPILENLAILGTVGQGYFNLNISAPELKKLKITLDTENTDDTLADYNDLNVLVSALKQFFVFHNTLANYVLKNLKSLVEASIDLVYHDRSEYPVVGGRGTTFLASFCNVKSLFLSAHGLDNFEMPVFGNLKQLELILHRCGSWWGKFLKSTPVLEVLVLEYCDCSCYGIIENELVWHPPELVPKCLLSHVKTIRFATFKGTDFEYDMANYFLQNGEVLNSMQIYTDPDVVHTKDTMLQKLLVFERGSKTCQVEIA